MDMWLNSISKISSLIHNTKTKFVYAGVLKTIGLSLTVILLESFLLIISLPVYIFISPEKFSEEKKEVEKYRLKRRFSLIGLAGFFLLVFLKITLFSGLFLSAPIRIKALSVRWDFGNPSDYIYDPGLIKLTDGAAIINYQEGVPSGNKPPVPAIEPIDSLPAPNIINWTGFTEMADKNGGNIYYQLSNDNGKIWYYWDGANWAEADADEYNEAAVIDGKISGFQPVNEQIKFRAFFPENNSAPIRLFGINLTYDGISPEDYGIYSDYSKDNFWFYHKFEDGYWIFGIRQASSAIAIDSGGQCVKYDGEVRECRSGDQALAISIKSLLRK